MIKDRPEAGQKAPNFSGSDQQGNPVSLDSYKGKKLILFFYPEDDTPICTKVACNLRDNYAELIQKGFALLGVSPDGSQSHQDFIKSYQLPFPLLVDTDKKVMTAYGTWGEKNMYGKMVTGVLRSTFIIDEAGKIVKVIRKVDSGNHTAQILKAFK